MTSETGPLDCDGPVLIFGGPYSNLQATEAVLATARNLGFEARAIICTGDMAAYCGDPSATIDLIRSSGIHVVLGNCDEQLAAGAETCGCGFPDAGLCQRLSVDWFTFANTQVRSDQRTWLASLPRRIDLKIAGKRLAVVHGGVGQINRFIFATTPERVKIDEIEDAGADGVIAGHCGLPFTQTFGERLWHNAGVIGMPANDGTPRSWFSILRPERGGIAIEHRALTYDHRAAADAMGRAGLSDEYRIALGTGVWPSCEVLPEQEKTDQGKPIAECTTLWRGTATSPRGTQGLDAPRPDHSRG